jgi:hypothetical protein
MSKLENDAARKKAPEYYKVCPHCGAAGHVKNEFCLKCKKSMKEPGKADVWRVSNIEREYPRANLDRPEGCASCGLGCRFCFSYGVLNRSPKARCEHCEVERRVCCGKAAKLAAAVAQDLKALLDILKDSGARAEFEKMKAEKTLECWAHTKNNTARERSA